MAQQGTFLGKIQDALVNIGQKDPGASDKVRALRLNNRIRSQQAPLQQESLRLNNQILSQQLTGNPVDQNKAVLENEKTELWIRQKKAELDTLDNKKENAKILVPLAIYSEVAATDQARADSILKRTIVKMRKAGEDASPLISILDIKDVTARNKRVDEFIALGRLGGVLEDNEFLSATDQIRAYKALGITATPREILSKKLNNPRDNVGALLQQARDRLLATPEELKVMDEIEERKASRGRSRMRTVVTTNPDGSQTTTFEEERGGDISARSKGTLENALIQDANALQRLEVLESNLDEAFFTEQAQFAVEVQNIAKRLRIPLAKVIKKTPQQIKDLAIKAGFKASEFKEDFAARFNTFKTDVFTWLQDYRIAVTGVQAGFEEIKDIQKNTLNIKLSSLEAVPRIAAFLDKTRRHISMTLHFLDKGFGGLENESDFSLEERNALKDEVNAKILPVWRKGTFIKEGKIKISFEQRFKELKKAFPNEGEAFIFQILEGEGF